MLLIQDEICFILQKRHWDEYSVISTENQSHFIKRATKQQELTGRCIDESQTHMEHIQEQGFLSH